MKARIKKTGEIVNVAEYAKITLEQCDSWGNPVELSPDEVELIDESKQRIATPYSDMLQERIDKERRFQILVAAIPAVVERNNLQNQLYRIAADACNIADAVFAEWQSRELKRSQEQKH